MVGVCNERILTVILIEDIELEGLEGTQKINSISSHRSFKCCRV